MPLSLRPFLAKLRFRKSKPRLDPPFEPSEFRTMAEVIARHTNCVLPAGADAEGYVIATLDAICDQPALREIALQLRDMGLQIEHPKEPRVPSEKELAELPPMKMERLEVLPWPEVIPDLDEPQESASYRVRSRLTAALSLPAPSDTKAE